MHPLEGLEKIDCKDIQIVFQESDQRIRDQYRAKCPNLITDKYTFHVMSVRE